MFQVDINFYEEPIGRGKNGRYVYLKDIWPSNEEVSKVEKNNRRFKL